MQLASPLHAKRARGAQLQDAGKVLIRGGNYALREMESVGDLKRHPPGR